MSTYQTCMSFSSLQSIQSSLQFFSFDWAFSKLLNADHSHLSNIGSFKGLAAICLIRVISKYFSAAFLDAKSNSCFLSSSEMDSSHGFRNKPFLGWCKGWIGVFPLSLLGPELDEPRCTCLERELHAANSLLLAYRLSSSNSECYSWFYHTKWITLV